MLTPSTALRVNRSTGKGSTLSKVKWSTVDELVDATDGQLLQRGILERVNGVTINSREVKRGQLFVAIKGEKFDAHQFVGQVVRKGAVALVVSRKVKVPKRVSVILVQNTTKALGQIAAAWRSKFHIPLVAITGSAGKTTCKEMIASVLSQKFKTLKTEKNLNNQFGVPLTLFRLNASHQAAVLELGTNQPGDIAWLTSIAQPTIAVLLNIGDSHLERLRNRQGVFREKSMITRSLTDNDVLVYNKDDNFLMKLVRRKMSFRKISFGIESPADVRASKVRINRSASVSFQVGRRPFQIKHPGKFLVPNALAAICCGRELGISDNSIAQGLRRSEFIYGRQQILRVGSNVIIDDSYNANPTSFAGALETLCALPCRGRRIVICADMLELGKDAGKQHAQCARFVKSSAPDLVLSVGKHMEHLHRALNRQRGKIEAQHFKNQEALQDFLKTIKWNADVILVKGSRGMQMEKIVEWLKKRTHDK